MASVDVIVPCYNYGSMLEGCVESLLTQEGVDVRVFIMDDASIDETQLVGKRLALRDRRVNYTRHNVNLGHIATYNEALRRITADYCVLLSADDLLTPGSLARATRMMDEHREVGLAYGRDIAFRHTPPAGVARDAKQCTHRIMRYAEFLERSCRIGHTPIQAPAAIVRTSVHRRIGNYRPELPHSGDTEIWLRMAAHAAVAELDADQAFRRLHARNMSLDYTPLARLEEQKKAFDTHFDQFRATRPESREFRPVAHRAIAEGAFWNGARAFDEGDDLLCDAFLSFARSTSPDIVKWSAWRRFVWKRRIGRTASRWLAPMAARVGIGRTAVAVERR